MSEVVTPGQTIPTEPGFLRGHGTHVLRGNLIASVAGVVHRVNKLVSVVPLKTRYSGQVGDVVVGRISDVGQKRWSVDINATQHAILMLSSVDLPGDVQRRRTHEDQLNMRSLYAEGDLICAEVHQFFQDGTMSVHTRSGRYGRLRPGMLVEAPAVLVRRMKQHFHSLRDGGGVPLGVDLVLSSNGLLWLSPTPPPSGDMEVDPDAPPAASEAPPPPAGGGGGGGLAGVGAEELRRMARVRNSIAALAASFLEIHPASIIDTYDHSLALGLSATAMLEPDKLVKVTEAARRRRDEQVSRMETDA